MKKLLLMMTASVFIFSACSEDEEASTYEKTEFYGTWELTNSTSADYAECPDNPPLLTMGASEISFPVINTSNGCNSGSFETAYDFNGSKFTISLFGQQINYTIISQTENEFTWEDDFEGSQETYVKVN